VIEQGTLVQVLNPAQGSSLTVDVAAGAEVLPVASLSDFYDDGGILQAGDNTYVYSGFDPDAKTLLLDDPLTTALSEGDEVLSLNALGRPESSWVAEVLIDEDDEDPIEADIPTGMRELFAPGTTAAGALVDVETTATGYRVASRPVDPDEMDGTRIFNPEALALKFDDQPIPHVEWTTVTGWFPYKLDRVTYDGFTGRFTFLVDGAYDIRFGATITSGAIGNRGVRMRYWNAEGLDIGVSRMFKALGEGSAVIETNQIRRTFAGLSVSFEVQQQSGAELLIAGGDILDPPLTECAIRYVGPL
jgi:hypothetical protein